MNWYNRSATGSAAAHGASKTVNGYMSFVLFSVAGLACTLSFFLFCDFFPLVSRVQPAESVHGICRVSVYSYAILWIVSIHADSALCWRVSVGRGPFDGWRWR